jgi:hypothetical protein
MLDDEGGCALPEPLHLDEPKWPNVLFCPFLDFFLKEYFLDILLQNLEKRDGVYQIVGGHVKETISHYSLRSKIIAHLSS